VRKGVLDVGIRLGFLSFARPSVDVGGWVRGVFLVLLRGWGDWYAMRALETVLKALSTLRGGRRKGKRKGLVSRRLFVRLLARSGCFGLSLYRLRLPSSLMVLV